MYVVHASAGAHHYTAAFDVYELATSMARAMLDTGTWDSVALYERDGRRCWSVARPGRARVIPVDGATWATRRRGPCNRPAGHGLI